MSMHSESRAFSSGEGRTMYSMLETRVNTGFERVDKGIASVRQDMADFVHTVTNALRSRPFLFVPQQQQAYASQGMNVQSEGNTQSSSQCELV